MRLLKYISKRMLFVLPQLFGIITVSFFLLKLIPGDPALMMLGPMASEETLEALRADLALDKSLVEQFIIYIKNILNGDLGNSWQTTRPVTEDLLKRFPATLELVTLSLFLALFIGIPVGVIASLFKRSIVNKFSTYYGLLAGSLPDFWLALIFIYFFYTLLGWSAAPMGRLDLGVLPPTFITGSYFLDSLFSGDMETFFNIFDHLVLPVLTLGLVNAGPIIKMTQSTMDRMLESDHIRYARSCGLNEFQITRRALRNSLPSVLTIVSVLYSFLIGGAVLVEIVFSWGGAGQYALSGVLNADINPVMGFAIWSAVLCLILYLIVDLIYFAIDPRLRD